MARDFELLRAAMQAVIRYDRPLPLLVMATADSAPMRALAAEMDVMLWFETFTDRAYDAQGHLASRRLPGPCIMIAKRSSLRR